MVLHLNLCMILHLNLWKNLCMIFHSYFQTNFLLHFHNHCQNRSATNCKKNHYPPWMVSRNATRTSTQNHLWMILSRRTRDHDVGHASQTLQFARYHTINSAGRNQRLGVLSLASFGRGSNLVV